jgi:hypothetical protein
LHTKPHILGSATITAAIHIIYKGVRHENLQSDGSVGSGTHASSDNNIFFRFAVKPSGRI